MGYFEHWMITIGFGGVLGVIGIGLRIAAYARTKKRSNRQPDARPSFVRG
jgi:hypothetical protein